MSSNIEGKVTELLEPIINKLGYELYDVYYVKEAKDYFLRIMIDKPDGIDINDCEKVTNAINDPLDEADLIKEQYFLEVSSSGLERVLRKEKHFQSQIGNEVVLKLYKPLEKQKEIQGILEEYNDNNIIIKQGENKIIIEKSNVSVAKTVFEF